MNLSLVDICVFAGYCLLIPGIGLFVSRNKKGKKKDSSDILGDGEGLMRGFGTLYETSRDRFRGTKGSERKGHCDNARFIQDEPYIQHRIGGDYGDSCSDIYNVVVI